MLLVDTVEKQFMKDEVLKENIVSLRPVDKWLEEEVNIDKMFCCNIYYMSGLLHLTFSRKIRRKSRDAFLRNTLGR